MSTLPDPGRHPNRLIHEKSPYLLQHSYNPVDWYPWGDEAFAKAMDEDKPIFLSIGYSTCYWCHVMEREVFEDTAIARLMNEKLICIKVDREERPDIDRIYMMAVQAMTGSGGWPMSVFMTPERKPFFGGTYIPPKAQYGRPGFPDLIERVDSLWHHERDKLVGSGNQIAEMLATRGSASQSSSVPDSSLDLANRRYMQSFDSEYAGFGGAPKFPRPVVFTFLLRHYSATGNNSALQMTIATLRAMARGGVYDQIGGGFHRYSVDGQWRVPHFEKMLYDQAQLVSAYLEAYQLTSDKEVAEVARDILTYVLRNLRDAQGGFYSAEDAESALDPSTPHVKEEGAFYLWKTDELDRLLSKESAAIMKYHYGATDSGNALHDPQHLFMGKNIFYVAHSLDETARQFEKKPEEIEASIATARTKLFASRETRPRPHLDDKIITAWNGLMISACSKAYQVLGDKKYLDAAENAANFISTYLYNRKSNTLLRRYRDGDARFEGGLQDYAFYIAGLLDLYESSFNIRWLNEAIELSKSQIDFFLDRTNGGFFDAIGSDPTLLTRTKEEYDGAEPTGNSVAAMNFLRLARMTDNKEWESIAEQTITAFGSSLRENPEILPAMLAAMSWQHAPPTEIIIAGNLLEDDTRLMLKQVYSRFIPQRILILADGTSSHTAITSYLPFISAMTMINGKATAYICKRYACTLPLTDPVKVEELLSEMQHHNNNGTHHEPE